jgi:hypothetical protein
LRNNVAEKTIDFLRAPPGTVSSALRVAEPYAQPGIQRVVQAVGQ